MKVALVNPPILLPKSWGLPLVFQNLGLMYVASAMQACGHKVKVIDAVGENWKHVVESGDSYYCGMPFSDILKTLATFEPDAVGLSSIFTVNAGIVKTLVSEVKENLPAAKIMVGGADVVARPKEYDIADCIVLGEGESAAENIASNHVYSQHFIENLDDVAFPARDLFPMDEYFKAYDAGRACRNKYVCDRRWTSMITTRGCPFNCIFCSIHLSMGWKLRKRSLKNIEEEVDILVNGKLRIRHINFEDDNISLDKKRFKSFLAMIKRYGISWSLPNGIRADTLDEDIVREMARSGCRRLFVAPEVGVQRVLDDIVHKNLSLSAVEKAVQLFVKYGVTVDAAFIVGFIGETKRDILNTIRYACKLKRLGIDNACFGVATPFYGTELYSQAVASGCIPENFSLARLSPFESLISTEQWNADWVMQAKEFARWYTNLPLWRRPFSMLKMFLFLKNRKYAYDCCRFWLHNFATGTEL